MKTMVAVALLSLLTVTGCVKRTEAEIALQRQDYTQRNNATGLNVVDSDRIVVKRISVIQDSLAYGDKRGVYVIIDTQTGKEYIGVSGVGITESGSHTVSSGKTTSTREHEH